jgi:hypothetical protein
MSRTLIGRLVRRASRRPLADTAEQVRAMCPPPATVEQVWPRMHVWRPDGGVVWWWSVVSPDARVLGTDCAPSWQQALEVGMAHLAVHTATWAIDELGAELPSGWERLP